MSPVRTDGQTAHRQAAEASTADIARFLEETLGRSLSAHVAGGVSPKTVGRWVEGERPRRGAEERLRTAFHVFQLLLTGGDSEHTVRAWFIGLNPQLDDVAPAQALHDGQLREVMVAAKSFVRGG